MGVGALVLGVHALSQAPQSEFALPFVPVWIVAALVGLLAPRGGQEPAPGDDAGRVEPWRSLQGSSGVADRRSRAAAPTITPCRDSS